MAKRLILVACMLLLGGCALPVPLQIASWAADGISYLVTQKSLTDHGLSMVADKDCALLRAVTEGHVCRDDDAATAVADAGTKLDPAAGFADGTKTGPAVTPPSIEIVSVASSVPSSAPSSWKEAAVAETSVAPSADADAASMPAAEQLAAMETAAGPADQTAAVKSEKAGPAAAQAETAAVVAVKNTEAVPAVATAASKPWAQLTAAIAPSPKVVPAALRIPADVHLTTVKVAAADAPKLFLVMGSFASQENAIKLAKRHADLKPFVLMSHVGDRKVYRVAFGVARDGALKASRARLAARGVVDVWAARMDAAVWAVTAVVPAPTDDTAGGQLARASPPSAAY